jgi:hypothetical protein
LRQPTSTKPGGTSGRQSELRGKAERACRDRSPNIDIGGELTQLKRELVGGTHPFAGHSLFLLSEVGVAVPHNRSKGPQKTKTNARDLTLRHGKL